MKNYERILKANPDAVVATDIRLTDQEALFSLYYTGRSDWKHNYRAYVTGVSVRMTRDRIRYRGEGQKAFSEKAFLTGLADCCRKSFEFRFATKADEKTASAWTSGLPDEILRLEADYMKRKKESIQRKKDRELERMQALFEAPVISQEAAAKRGKELIPKYMIVKDHEGQCSACSTSGIPVSVQHAKQMLCPKCGAITTVMDLKRKSYQYDFLWIIAPDLRGDQTAVSYFRYSQTISEGKITANCGEEARSIGNRQHNRECWCRNYDGSWYRGTNPHFMRTACGSWTERADWCERGYVIPDQFTAYLRKACADARRIPLEAFFSNNEHYDWMMEADSLFNALRDANTRRVIRMLVKAGLPRIADPVSVSDRICFLDMNAKSLKKLLKLSGSRFTDFMASDRTLTTLKTAQSGQVKSFITPDTGKYMEYVTSKIPRMGLSAGTSFLLPVAASGNTRMNWSVTESVEKDMSLRESLEVACGDAAYRKIGNHFYKINVFNTPKLLLPDDLKACIGDRIPVYSKWLLKNNTIRKKLLNVASSDQVVAMGQAYELLDKAGFTAAAKEIRNALTTDDRLLLLSPCSGYIMDVIGRIGCGKLYKMLGISRRLYHEIDRENVSIYRLKTACSAYANDQDVSYASVIRLCECLLSYPDLTVEAFTANGMKISDTLSYLDDNRIHAHEYTEYIKNLLAVQPAISRKAAFPKDFEKAQLNARGAVRAKEDEPKIAAMRKISEALRTDKRIRKYLSQNKGYLVFVPESPLELIREGERLHNCLRLYVDKVAEGNTSVFFIREADNPEAPYYAMEVQDGRMIQLHGINNCRAVENSPVETFARGFAKVLDRIHFDPKQALTETPRVMSA